MAQVTVTIAGKVYRMACGDGEEAHLEGLAAALADKIAELRAGFGEIGEMRLHVMAALMMADELAETKRRVAGLEEQLQALSEEAGSGDSRIVAAEDRMAGALTKAAERIERVARSLSSNQNPG